ncbi:MAG: D-glycero-alpha-D-manno-heptose-7-phosphate kinase [Arenicella sp.]|jgi:D-glycero-alpha-D-manno-heptose-7-phosphate kinase
MKVVKSRAPFRIGLAGGGTDVSPYSERYGGIVLNTTISLYAKTTLIPQEKNIIFENAETGEIRTFEIAAILPTEKDIILQIGAYNHIIRQFNIAPFGFRMVNEMDVQTGSGLGTSSTILVSILAAFNRLLNLDLGKRELAEMAVKIERQELKMAGGKQDQYAATYGGTNFLTFTKEGKVDVETVELSSGTKNELEFNLILFYNEQRRDSSKIIEAQMLNIESNKEESIQATHEIKDEAIHLKEELAKNQLNAIGEILNKSWENKKKMARGITNQTIDLIYNTAMENGAEGGKISGAGGGGFILFYVESAKKNQVIQALQTFNGNIIPFRLVDEGVQSWVVEE